MKEPFLQRSFQINFLFPLTVIGLQFLKDFRSPRHFHLVPYPTGVRRRFGVENEQVPSEIPDGPIFCSRRYLGHQEETHPRQVQKPSRVTVPKTLIDVTGQILGTVDL